LPYYAKTGNILIVDDNEDILFALNLLLQPHVEKVKVTTQPERIEHFISTFHPDVILLDMNFNRDASSGQEGFFWLDKIKKADPDTVVIFITAYADTDKAVRAIKAGATDFISKPWEKEKLLATVSAALELRKSKNEISSLKQQVAALESNHILPEIIGESTAMQDIRHHRKIKRYGCQYLYSGRERYRKGLNSPFAVRQLSSCRQIFRSYRFG